MNRGGNPLQQRAGLVRRPLKAGKGLERKPKLQAVDGDKSKPAKRKTARDTGPTRKMREAVLERDQHPEDVEILLARVNDEGEVRFDFYLLDNVGGVQLALFPSPAPVDPFDYTPEPAEEGDAAA